ncbi:MAG TPA: hypothetical protein VFG20_01605 [Planctomycetaceae bacterium]|nr:hypothetical protein [Planctomycetaceae bacterium]
MRSKLQGLIAGGVCGLLLVTAGCGGGASAHTTVRFRPSHPEAAAEAVAATETTGAATETTAAAEGFGSLKGRVVVQGDLSNPPPQYPAGGAPKDPTVCGVTAIPNETVVVNNGGLANVFIYLAKSPKKVPPPPSTPVVFDQKSCIFLPHALVVQTNQPVTILNDDAALHNTHTYPKRNSVFNQGVQPNDRTGVNLVYTRAESQPFQVGCDVHPWMVAYHLPVDHPYAVVSGPDGTFEIKDLPAGKHEFKVWHEKGGELQKALSITIKANETTEQEIPVAASKLAQFQGPASKVIQLSSAR